MNKNKDLHIRLTDEQMEKLKEKASAANMTISEFVIFACDLDLVTSAEYKEMDEQALEDFIAKHEDEAKENYYFETAEEMISREQIELEKWIAENQEH